MILIAWYSFAYLVLYLKAPIYDPGYLRQYLFFLNKLVNYYRSIHISHFNKGEHLNF